MYRRKALVIGSGIAGPVTAVALQRAGMEAVVHEAHSGPAESMGLFLGLGVNGMRALDEVDLLEPVLGAPTIPTPRMEFSSTTGRRLGVVSNVRLEDGTPSVTLSRGALQKALADAAQARGVRIHYGKRLVGYSTTSGSVTARFNDGSDSTGDLLIGADGIHSLVRRSMSPDAPAPSYTGLLNLGGRVRDSGLEPTPETMHMVWGRRAFFGYTVRPGGEAWWFANIGERAEPSRDALAALTSDEWRRRAAQLFADDPPFIRRLIEHTPEIGATPIHDLPSIPCWQRGRVALVGDAAHAVSPSAGQGASLAIEDALVLAKCLRDVAPIEDALARYEELRRPRAERVVATGRQRGAYKAPANRAALWLRDLLMPVVFRFVATEERMAWIHDYRVAWDEPVTAATA
jgi:FAD-dependent urate hydroxylase